MSWQRLEEMPSLMPADFFAFEGEIKKVKKAPSPKEMQKSHLLPDLSALLAEERFADLALAWNPEALFISLFAHQEFEEALFPRYAEGDALEIFIDTRDLKTAGFATRFCHQFFFLPQALQGIQAGEVTRFRTEDTHPLCDAGELHVETVFQKKSYEMHLVIPAHVLHGFDPTTCDRLGFAYRIFRARGRPQHFSFSSDHFSLEQNPRLWASLKLKEA
ncbi:MAG: hypothetical protein JSS61_06835 [Verrucomicrobia bacterium]|nr:hypothetical protein [Verrucomicrobiota bacterium]